MIAGKNPMAKNKMTNISVRGKLTFIAMALEEMTGL